MIELPKNWDATNFKWPEATSDTPTRVDVGAKTPEEVAKLGISIGDTITIAKAYRPLLGTRANGRSFDDRVGCAALISAVWSFGGALKNRDVTFVWSTGEELGLVGAAKLAARLDVYKRQVQHPAHRFENHAVWTHAVPEINGRNNPPAGNVDHVHGVAVEALFAHDRISVDRHIRRAPVGRSRYFVAGNSCFVDRCDLLCGSGIDKAQVAVILVSDKKHGWHRIPLRGPAGEGERKNCRNGRGQQQECVRCGGHARQCSNFL